jgi:uncharacterized protein (TIGR03435 family)
MSHFEVVSVKLNTQDPAGGPYSDKCTGGPGQQSPSLWICPRTNLIGLLNQAFGLEVYQFMPRPDWMVRTFLTVETRLPADTTKAQFQEMLRNMLIERFGLVWHWKESEATVYKMVRDPAGAKLRESAPDASAAVVNYESGRPAGTTIGKDRYPILPEGVSALVGMNNHHRWRSSNVTTADIAWVLRWEFMTDVIDETGLTGHYEVDLHWESPNADMGAGAIPFEGPDAKTEFRKQLGLRLEPIKGTVKTFVVDHMDKTPTGD